LDGTAFKAIARVNDDSKGGMHLFGLFLVPAIVFRILIFATKVLTSTILEQIFEIEYLVQHTQCADCAKLAAKNTWKALVQVRQKVAHKRTFLFLEQLILKHGAQKDTISVREVRDGLDFFYSQRSHAIKMVEFLGGVVAVR